MLLSWNKLGRPGGPGIPLQLRECDAVSTPLFLRVTLVSGAWVGEGVLQGGGGHEKVGWILRSHLADPGVVRGGAGGH